MAIEDKVYNLIDTMRKIKANPNTSTLTVLKNELNKFYKDSTCRGVLYTNNTDKMFFGMCVLPVISDGMAVDIVQSDMPIRLDNYYIELDSKLFDPLLNLTDTELTAILLHEVGHVINDASPVENVRKQVDLYLAKNRDTLTITDSVYYRNILAFAFADTIRKITSIFFDTEEIKADQYVIKCNLGGDLDSAMQKIQKNGFNINKDVDNRFVVLCWTLRLYKNVKMRRIAALRSISKAKALTPSQLEKNQLEGLDSRLRRIDDASLIESVIKEFPSLSKKVSEAKIRGLKSFEQEYYEYAIMINNVVDQDEALYIMRQLNSRLSIIENYIETEHSSSNKRWSELHAKYIKLRDQLSSKIVYKDRFIGIQVNYPNIKGLDY